MAPQSHKKSLAVAYIHPKIPACLACQGDLDPSSSQCCQSSLFNSQVLVRPHSLEAKFLDVHR